MNLKKIYIINKLKHSLSALKRFYRIYNQKNHIKSEFSKNFNDNFFFIFSLTKQLLKVTKQHSGEPVCNKQSADLYQIITEKIFAKSEPLSEELLIETLNAAQENCKFSSVQISFLKSLIQIILVELLCGTLRSSDQKKYDYVIDSIAETENIDFNFVLENVSSVEKILAQDPASIYPYLTEQTKNLYRFKINRIAKQSNTSESEAAGVVLQKARNSVNENSKHVGFHIFNTDKYEKSRRKRAQIFLVTSLLLPIIIAAGIAIILDSQPAWIISVIAVIAYIPIRQILKPIINLIFGRIFTNDFIPSLDLSKSPHPKPNCTIILPTVITASTNASSIRTKLLDLYYSNYSDNVNFVLLCDFKEDNSPTCSYDHIITTALSDMISELNESLHDCFMLLVRPRKFIKTQNKFAGYERKRGAIADFVRFVRGQPIDFIKTSGRINALIDSQYMLVIDEDTKLSIDSLDDLLGCALHPLNKPVVENGRVTSGYAVFVPKISLIQNEQKSSLFTKIMAVDCGHSTYDCFTSDLYQNIFAESNFAGKGLINIDIFYQTAIDIFPEQHVLSHDILEGNLLRTAFVPYTSFFESFPKTTDAFYKRQHRWIRGDFQNASFLGSRFKSNIKADKITIPSGGLENIFGTRRSDGKAVVKNPMTFLGKYKIFDNILTALIPACAFLLMLFTPFLPFDHAVMIFLTATLSVSFPDLFSAFYTLCRKGLPTIFRTYYSEIFPSAIGDILRGIHNILLLPLAAFFSFDALIKSFVRVCFTRKNLLQWATAASLQNNKFSPAFYLISHLPLIILVTVLLTFAEFHFLMVSAAFFILSLLYEPLCSVPFSSDKHGITGGQYNKLLAHLSAMWNYFDDTMTKEDNYLPIDNLQIAPVYIKAHRTSPTNIGLALLSITTAYDFGLISQKDVIKRIDNTISTIEKMKKYRGNLYNWYDTKTLEILPNYFVSAVDSGNFATCLVALKESLLEYKIHDQQVKKLIERINALIDNTDLSIFYNEHRNLLSIGITSKDDKVFPAHYDFFMSEARTTSYFSIARREIKKRHWNALSRTLIKNGLALGCISWTGTMFEYLMPHLLLPNPHGSLLYESIYFAINSQKKRGKAMNKAWGNSESAFYAFDSALNYQYKAHGVGELAVKPGQNDEFVVSPYSSFLALPYDPKHTMENLGKLENLGLLGQYGFYEAIDFTRNHNRPLITKSYMSHHIGMSVISIANTLKDDLYKKRFMKDPQMKAAKYLLDEKIPADTTVFDKKQTSVKMNSKAKTPQFDISDKINPKYPKFNLFANGELSLSTADDGQSFIIANSVDITARTVSKLRYPNGIFFFVNDGQENFSPTKAPFFQNDDGIKYECAFSNDKTEYRGIKNNTEIISSHSLDRDKPISFHSLRIRNNAKTDKEYSFFLYFEPVISKFDDLCAHPAYSKLFVTGEFDLKNNCLIFKRKHTENNQSLYLAVGFADNSQIKFSTNRKNILNSPDGINSLKHTRLIDLDSSITVADCCCTIGQTVKVPKNSAFETEIIISVSNSKATAIDQLITQRAYKKHSLATSVSFGDMLENRLCSRVLPALMIPPSPTIQSMKAIQKGGITDLYALSISGDFPIILYFADVKNPDEHTINALFDMFLALNTAFIPANLVVAYSELPMDNLPFTQKLKDLSDHKNMRDMIGARNGIFFINFTQYDQNARDVLLKYASVILPGDETGETHLTKAFKPFEITPCSPQYLDTPDATEIIGGKFTDNQFIITEKTTVPHTLILANRSFGTLVSNKALGFTYALNSRELKLTPWQNDPSTDNQGELLLVRTGGKIYNTINGSTAAFSDADASYYGQFESIKSTVNVTISEKGFTKFIELHLISEIDTDAEIAFYTEPILGVNHKRNRFITAEYDGKNVVLQNCYDSPYRPYMGITSNSQTHIFCGNKASFLTGQWQSCDYKIASENAAAIIVKAKIQKNTNYSVTFKIAFGNSKKSLLFMLENNNQKQKPIKTKIMLNSPDKSLNLLFNHFTLNQIIKGRLFSRTGFYQCSGAYGFRDQLQDITAIINIEPNIARTHIIRCCASQFTEGDVLHWWHNMPKQHSGKCGVRTKYSDDFLWLPYALAEYVTKTNDRSILDVNVSYLEAPPLSHGEKDRFLFAESSQLSETVFNHAKRAVERGMIYGEHGLSLIGGGDWNDGFNTVGINGKGESVWLTMFYSIVLEKFAKICRIISNDELANAYLRTAKILKKAVDDYAYDQKWYLRAFYDDGDVMGSKNSDGCEIDLLPQAFAVFADMPDKLRVKSSLDSAYKYLVDDEFQIIKLFTPSFEFSQKKPGYVKKYPDGIRENGGQYTHAAVWFAMALFEFGDLERASGLLQYLNPMNKYSTQKLADSYLIEPYYLAGDIYSNPNAYAQGGWSLYSGSAAWFYRLIAETVLGIQINNDKLILKPKSDLLWNRFSVQLNIRNTEIAINAHKDSKKGLYFNENKIDFIPLDGKKRIISLLY